MTPTRDIQAGSQTDEPEIPSTKRDGDREGEKKAEPPKEQQAPEGPAAEQRPPADS